MRPGRASLRHSALARSTYCTSPDTLSSTRASPPQGGLLCAGKEVLRGADLANLGNLPALVFCNACEAARVRKRTGARVSPARQFGMRRTMTGIAEAFLTGGVANFLGTHWPVGDDAALAFSQSLYRVAADR